jgi:hypothetical protein
VLKKFHLTAACIFLCWLTFSCSSSNNNSAPSSFAFTVPTSSPSIDAGQSVTLTVNASATWSLLPGAGYGHPVGTLSNTTTPSNSVTYSAPSAGNLSGATQVIVVATSSANTSVTAAMVVLVNQAVSLETVQTHLTSNQNCSYSPTLGNNDGTVGATYAQNSVVSSLAASGGTPPYTWILSPGFSLPPGLILQSTTNVSSCTNSSGASGCAFLFGTPSAPGCTQVQVQVTDSVGLTATSPTYNVVIVPAPLKVQVPNFTDLTTGVPYPPMAMSVSGGTPPYTWGLSDPATNPWPPGINLTVSSGGATAYLSGTPNPTSLLQPIFFVSDSQTPYPAISPQVTLNFGESGGLSPACSTGTNNNYMQGSYAFMLRGFDSTGPVVIAGSFTTDGAGNVTAGEEDVMRSTGSQAALPIEPANSSYAVFSELGDEQNFETPGCVTLATSAGTMTFSFTVGGCTVAAGGSGICGTDSQGNPGIFTNGRLIESEAGTQLSGIVRLQNASAFSSGWSGTYAFGLSGRDPAGGRFASAGSFSASSTALSSVAADINDAGAVQSTQTGGTGTVSSVDANGRATVTVNVGTETFNLATYMVNAQDLLLASTGTLSTTNPIVSGEAVGTTGPFSAASLENSQMFRIGGLSSSGPDVSIGVVSFDGVGSFSGTQYEDQSGTLATTALSGAYTVDPNSGRVWLNETNTVLHPLVGYAVPVPSTLTRQGCAQPWSCVTGFLVSTDASAQYGLLEFQTPSTEPPPPFSDLYVSGYYFYGTDESLDPETPVIEGASWALPNGAEYTGVLNASYSTTSVYCQLEPGCATLFPYQTFNGKSTYSVSSNGTGTVGGETVAITNGNVIFYIDESPVNLHPTVIVAEQ